MVGGSILIRSTLLLDNHSLLMITVVLLFAQGIHNLTSEFLVHDYRAYGDGSLDVQLWIPLTRTTSVEAKVYESIHPIMPSSTPRNHVSSSIPADIVRSFQKIKTPGNLLSNQNMTVRSCDLHSLLKAFVDFHWRAQVLMGKFCRFCPSKIIASIQFLCCYLQCKINIVEGGWLVSRIFSFSLVGLLNDRSQPASTA